MFDGGEKEQPVWTNGNILKPVSDVGVLIDGSCGEESGARESKRGYKKRESFEEHDECFEEARNGSKCRATGRF